MEPSVVDAVSGTINMNNVSVRESQALPLVKQPSVVSRSTTALNPLDAMASSRHPYIAS